MTDASPLLRLPAGGGFKGALDRALAWVCIALMAASVANVLWQVVTRFVLDSPSGFTDELARFLLIWLGLIGSAYAVGQRMHLAIDLLPSALDPRPRARATLGIVLQGAVLLFALGVTVYGGGSLVGIVAELGQRSPALGVSMSAVYSVLPISGALIAIYAAIAIADYVRVLRGAPMPERLLDASGGDELTAANLPS